MYIHITNHFIDSPNTHVHTLNKSLFLFGTPMKNGRIKLVLWDKTSLHSGLGYDV
jgi:hypothetical protein